MRTSRWKSSNCPLQEAPTPPSGKTLENKRMLGVPCVLKSLFSCAGQNFHLQLVASGAFSSPCTGAFEGGSSISQISLSPQLFLHTRVFRFSLTRTSAKNSIILRFRRLTRDSRFLVHGPFLSQLSSAASAKRAVRPRLVFLRPRGA